MCVGLVEGIHGVRFLVSSVAHPRAYTDIFLPAHSPSSYSATVTSYRTISQDLDDHRERLADRASEYQSVKESIMRDKAGLKV